MKVLLPATIGFAMLATSSNAETPAATYICIENRSVGWEKRESGEDFVGEFKAAEDRFFVRYYKGYLPPEGDFIKLAYIEVVEKDIVYTYTSAECVGVFVSFFGEKTSPFNSKENRIEYCSTREVMGFGLDGIQYRFFGKLNTLPPAISYTHSQNFLPDRAYLSSGQCVKSD